MMPEVDINENPLIRELDSLNLPAVDFALFGSAPLLAWGVRDRINDLDLIARGGAWNKAKRLGHLSPAPSGNGCVVHLAGGLIEIFDRWVDSSWDTNKLIDSADVFSGFKFVKIEMVYRWKNSSNRSKDQHDAAAMRRLLDCGQDK